MDHLRRVQWPQDFNPVKFEAYNGNANSIMWLEIYRLSIITVGGPFVMANYFVKCLVIIPRRCLLG
jgi:hypothetical protein